MKFLPPILILLLALVLTGCGTNWIELGQAQSPPLPGIVSSSKLTVASPKGAAAAIVFAPAPPVFNVPMDFQVWRAPDFDYPHIRTDIIASTDPTVPLFKWTVIGSLATNQTDFYFTATNAQEFIGTVMCYDPTL